MLGAKRSEISCSSLTSTSPSSAFLSSSKSRSGNLLRGFRSPSGVVSKPISGHSFDFFQNFFPGIDRPEHSAQKSVSVALAR